MGVKEPYGAKLKQKIQVEFDGDFNQKMLIFVLVSLILTIRNDMARTFCFEEVFILEVKLIF